MNRVYNRIWISMDVDYRKLWKMLIDKGIKNKNLRKFCGRYLVHYTVSAIDLYLKKHQQRQSA